MRAGKKVTDPNTKENVHANVVAYFKSDHLLKGFVTAFAAECRTGVNARHILSQPLFIDGPPGVYGVSSDARRRLLEEKVAVARREVQRATRFAMKAEDDDEADRFNGLARQARADERRLRAELEELAVTAENQPVNAPEFDVYGEVVSAALERLVTCGNQMTQEECHALDLVMRGLRVHRQSNGQWIAEASVRLNAADGVAEIGPIRWPLGAGGFGTQAVRATIEVPADAAHVSKRDLRRLLTDTHRVPHPAVATLLNAPFVQLPWVVLHGINGHPFPSWVGAQWRQSAFVAWVTGVYTDPDFAWLGNGKYVQLSHLRQLVVLLAARDGTTTPAKVQQLATGIDAGDIYRAARVYAEKRRARLRPWSNAVVDPVAGGSPRIADREVHPVKCRCGGPATVVARVPEVPRDLLCECGFMPESDRYGMDPEVRFPDEYMALQLTLEECVAQVQHRRELCPYQPTGATGIVWEARERWRHGTTAPEIAALVGLTDLQVYGALATLGRRQMVQRDDARPARWSVHSEQELEAADA